MGWTKLHASIIHSSIWEASKETRLVWVTMLAMADANGVVAASVGGLARAANVSRQECEQALAELLGPDPDSRDGTTGERIRKVEGGWEIINHANYRDRQTRAQELAAARVRRFRERKAAASPEVSSLTAGEHVTLRNVTSQRPSASVSDLICSPSASEKEREHEREGGRKSRSKPCPRPDDVDEATWESWLALRRAKRAPVSTIAVEGLRREARKANLDLRAVMAICCQNGWQGFHSDWLARSKTRGDAWADRFQKPPPGSALDKWMNSTEDVLGPYGQTEEQP